MKLSFPSANTLNKDRTLTELTVPTDPDELITSRYGRIKWQDYLIREAERIRGRNIDRTTIIGKHNNGRLSLWVNDVGNYAAIKPVRRVHEELAPPLR